MSAAGRLPFRALLALLAGLSAPAAAAAPDAITVVADDNYPPYVFRNSGGEAEGYLVDAWALWQKKTGVRVELVVTDWAKAQRLFADGKADVIDTIFRTAERERRLAFSRPYADLPVPIYHHRDIAGISSAETLRGFLVGVKEGDACAERLAEAGVSTQARFDSYQQIVDAALAGKIKVFCLDEPPANYLLYRQRADQDFRKAFVLYQGQFHRAVRKGDEALLAIVQQGFDAFSAEESAALRNKWMGSRLAAAPWVRGLAYGLAAVLVLGVAVAGWGFALRRQVRARTRELSDERLRLRTLVDTLPDLVWLKNADGVYLACNAEFERCFGAREADIVGRTDYDFVPRELADFFRDNDRQAIAAGIPRRNEEEVVYANDGRRAQLETIKTPMRDSDGRLIGVLGIGRDISARKQDEGKLRLAASVFESTVEGIVVTDPAGAILAVNPAFSEITGYAGEEAIGGNPRMLRSDRHEPMFYQEMWAALTTAGRWQGEIWNRRKNGEVYPEWQTISAVRDEAGAVTHYVAVFSDISMVKRSQEALEYLAHHDALTGLPNRALFCDRLEHALMRRRREKGMLAVLFVDLDCFKRINDTLGHAAGDEILRLAAQAMRDLLREEDTVARIGGDEFVLLIEGEVSTQSVAVVASKLVERFSRPFAAGGRALPVTVSIGISLYPDDGGDADALLKNADDAMYRAKEAGRSTFRFHCPEPLPSSPP